jgi:hypothetical protein
MHSALCLQLSLSGMGGQFSQCMLSAAAFSLQPLGCFADSQTSVLIIVK